MLCLCQLSCIHLWSGDVQRGCVKNVLDSLVLALQEDPNRKFVYVEQASWTEIIHLVSLLRSDMIYDLFYS